MSLTTWLEKLEAEFRHDDFRELVIVLEDDDGTWQVNGIAVDKTTVDPRTQVVVHTERADGPQ